MPTTVVATPIIVNTGLVPPFTPGASSYPRTSKVVTAQVVN